MKQIKKGKLDRTLDIGSILLLIGVTIFLIVIWHDIPDHVPMHHNFSGVTDRWGDKSEILFLLGMDWLMFLLVSVVGQHPRIWNTGVTVTKENKERVYAITLHMLTTTKFIIMLSFTYAILQTALVWEMSAWFLPLFLLILGCNTIFWFWKLCKAK